MRTFCTGVVYAVILLNVSIRGEGCVLGQELSFVVQPELRRPDETDFERRDRPLDVIGLLIDPMGQGRTPPDSSPDLFPEIMDPDVGHRLPELDIVYYWDAAELWHQPLYFDDPLLERYGQTPLTRWQPVLSGAHFFGTLPIMPYKLSIDRPMACVSTLGYYRPGSATPCLARRIPRDARAFGWETGAWLGLIFLVP